MELKSLDESANFLPKAKTLCVSQESSADFVQEALALGALGYVVKSDAGKELLTAVEAVVQGRQYLSSGLSSGNRAHATVTQAIRSVTQAGSPSITFVDSPKDILFFKDFFKCDTLTPTIDSGASYRAPW
jgi:DNA-binding NarL/FixJ family response regulator